MTVITFAEHNANVHDKNVDTKPTTSNEWPIPIPLVTTDEQAGSPFPLHALPRVIREAVSEYQDYGQQPLALVASSALANISLACQGLADVARDKYLISPISLYFLSVARSGERKTAADQAFGRAVRAWQKEYAARMTPTVETAQALHHAWRVERAGILSSIRRAAREGETVYFEQQRLMKNTADEPFVPPIPHLYFEDTTQEALALHLAHGWPSAALWSDEGGLVVGGQGMQQSSTKFVALLNRLWDGKSFVAHRKTKDSFTVANRRLTISLMLQPLILSQLLTRSAGISRESGFLARTLIAYPTSQMGSRFYQSPPTEQPALAAFSDKLSDCLRQSETEKPDLSQLRVISLSPTAKTRWVEFFNTIERGMGNKNQWEEIADFASKSPENVARLAALFHVFEGKSGDITLETVDQSIEIVKWYLLQTKEIFESSSAEHETKDAIKMLKWLTERNIAEVSIRHIQQSGPLSLRKRDKLDHTLSQLEERGYIKIIQKKRQILVQINPCFTK